MILHSDFQELYFNLFVEDVFNLGVIAVKGVFLVEGNGDGYGVHIFIQTGGHWWYIGRVL